MRREALCAAWLAGLAVAGCREKTFHYPLTLGDGRSIPPEVLNKGKETYEVLCFACHGEKGDGLGVAAAGLVPAPRNFLGWKYPEEDDRRMVNFKFVSTPANESLPTDEDLLRSVKHGLQGTAMLAWEISDERVRAILQYIKTFSPRWKDEAPAKPVEMSPDPFGPGKRADALELGKKTYHTKAQCSSCHPAYVTKKELEEFQVTRVDPYWAVAKRSEDYGNVAIVPPDFTWHPLRSIRENTKEAPERRKQDLYRAIAAGIGGAAMPTWKGALAENELWSIVYYLDSLIDLKDSPKRAAFWAERRGP
jgi:mono/diheme cytochrome c family protein